MSDIKDYKFDIKQVGPFHFDCNIETPEHLIFTNKGIQAHPSQINNELLFKHFLDKATKHHWALNVEIIPEVVPEVIEIIPAKPEIIEPIIEIDKQIIEVGPEITDKPIEVKPEIVKDEVVYES